MAWWQKTDNFARKHLKSWKYKNFTLNGRINNLADQEYVPWSDVFYLGQNDPSFIYANQLPLGSPRTYEVSIEASL